MTNQEPKVGDIYRHFKDQDYKIISVETADHCFIEDTWAQGFIPPRWVSNDIMQGDRVVIYKNLNRNYYCMRSIKSFCEEVTRPRFRLIE